MKTTLLIKQHQKCLEILAMIERAEYQIRWHQHDWRYNNPDPLVCIGKIKTYKAIRSRLINYYANTFNKMCQNVNV